MKPEIKKNIAREILILFSFIVVCLLLGAVGMGYSYFISVSKNREHYEGVRKQIIYTQKYLDSLNNVPLSESEVIEGNRLRAEAKKQKAKRDMAGNSDEVLDFVEALNSIGPSRNYANYVAVSRQLDRLTSEANEYDPDWYDLFYAEKLTYIAWVCFFCLVYPIRLVIQILMWAFRNV